MLLEQTGSNASHPDQDSRAEAGDWCISPFQLLELSGTCFTRSRDGSRVTSCPVPRGLFSPSRARRQLGKPVTPDVAFREQGPGEWGASGLRVSKKAMGEKKKLAEAEIQSHAPKELFVTMTHQATLFYIWSGYVNFLPQKEKSLSD